MRLSEQWQAAIDEGCHNTAKAIQVMMASQSPDEYSERRVTRSVDQRTTLTADVAVSRYSAMTSDELATERDLIEARREETEIDVADDADWRSAAVRLPTSPGKENIEAGTPDSGSQKRKSEVGV